MPKRAAHGPNGVGMHAGLPSRFPSRFIPNGVDLGKTRSGSRVGFRRIAEQAETLGEFRYVNSPPFGFIPDKPGVKPMESRRITT